MNNTRILIVDDNPDIHRDIRKILDSPTGRRQDDELRALEDAFFEHPPGLRNPSSVPNSTWKHLSYEIESALQGEEAIRLTERRVSEGRPFAMAFVDARIPPGIDGIETIYRLWEIDANMEIVLCTAFTDYSWQQITDRLGISDQLLFLRKPYDIIEVQQLAMSLTQKWNLARINHLYKHELENQVDQKKSIIAEMFRFANTLNSMGSMDAVLEHIVETAARIIHCDRISIMLLDEAGEYLTIRKSIGIPPEVLRDVRIKVGSGVAGAAFQKGAPIIVNSSEEMRTAGGYTEYSSFISTPFICAPMSGPSTRLGVLNITNHIGDLPFSGDDIDAAGYIAYSAAIAINNQLSETHLEQSAIQTIYALSEAIDAKDPYTRGHSSRVADYAATLAGELGLSTDESFEIYQAGLLHDIGKIGVPEAVLLKQARLTDEEYDIVKLHSVTGDNILKEMPRFNRIREIVRHHHERYDGSGYPDGLKGNQQSIGTRIMAVCDAFDAMNSNRVYRARLTPADLVGELQRGSGTQFDPECASVFINYLKREVFRSLA